MLACLRAADYLAGRPDFNGTDLAVTGGSQGGGLAIITAGAEPRVKLLAARPPACRPCATTPASPTTALAIVQNALFAS